MKITKLSISEAAPQLGVSIHALQAGLTRMNIKTSRGKRYTLKQLHTAAVGDFKFERTRSERAKADLLEMERKEKERELVPKEHFSESLFVALSPLRSALCEAPGVLAPRVNPQNPDAAIAPLREWSRQTFVRLHEHILRTSENLAAGSRKNDPTPDDGEPVGLGVPVCPVPRADEPRPVQPGSPGVPA